MPQHNILSTTDLVPHLAMPLMLFQESIPLAPRGQRSLDTSLRGTSTIGNPPTGIAGNPSMRLHLSTVPVCEDQHLTARLAYGSLPSPT
jgi:hypothetical protein